MTILVVANTLGLTAQLAQVCPQPKTPLSSFHNICTVYIRSPQPLDHVNGWLVHTCTSVHMRAQPHLPCHGHSWPHLHEHCCECHRCLQPNSYEDHHKHHRHLWPTCTSVATSVTGACGPSHMSAYGPTCSSNRCLCTDTHTHMHSHTHTQYHPFFPSFPPLWATKPEILGNSG